MVAVFDKATVLMEAYMYVQVSTAAPANEAMVLIRSLQVQYMYIVHVRTVHVQ